MIPAETTDVCAAVRLDMESVRDGRATPAERNFVQSHIALCPGCAGKWAFALAAKRAWQKLPTAYAPASLSARIAAATYRKPTFAERFAAAFVFLLPVPARVAVGVAAIAGIAYVTLPRLAPLSVAQNPVAVPVAKTVVAEAKPAAKKVEPVVEPAPVVAAVKPAPKPAIVAAPKPVVESVAPKAVVTVVTPKPAPKISTPVPVKRPTKQVATAIPVPKPVRVKPTAPILATTAPEMPRQSPAEIAPMETAPVAAIEKPAAREPAITVASMTVGERENVGSGFIRLGSQLSNAGRKSGEVFRGSAIVATNVPESLGIVTAPVK